MRHLTRAILSTVFLSQAAFAAGTSPSWAELSEPPAQETFPVAQYVDLADGTNLVVVKAGRADGMIAGATLKAFRLSKGVAGPLWVETGRLKVVDVQESVTVAAVEQQGSALAKALFPKFPQVMAGDVAVAQKVTLTRRQVVMPALALTYHELFEDPKANPATFELKAPGLDALKAAAKTFADARLSVLMIEGYTDHHGAASANQVESYQRAMTVRQYLIDELGFDENRVIAVGYGEAEPADASFAPGYVETNRRIVLKAVPVAGR